MLHLRERNMYMTEYFVSFFKISFKMSESSPYMAICKPRHWNLGIGIGIGIGIGTDITNAIISSYISPMDNKPSWVMT